VTTPDERLEELRSRALAADIEPVADPEELTQLSISAHLENAGLEVLPGRPELDMRLHGPGVPTHEIPVREAAAILNSVQEAVASIGQALIQEPTARGTIPARVLKATELHMSSSIGAGSVIFRLGAPGGQVLTEDFGAVGVEPLAARAITELLSVVDRSQEGQVEAAALAESMRHLGPRVAKHLSDLVKTLVDDGIDVDFIWRGDAPGRPRRASLQRQSALAIREAIKLNEVNTREVTLTGKLVTVSSVSQAELHEEQEGRIRLSVSAEDAENLGPFFNRRVVIRAEQVTMWSMQTGQEKRTYRLLGIDYADDGKPPAAS
jgi:hypothetical protein